MNKSKQSNSINIKKSNFVRIPSNKYNTIKLDIKEIRQLLGKDICMRDLFNDYSLDMPKYVYPIINQAAMMSGACYTRNIGHLHSLIKTRKFRSLKEWKRWYTKRYSDNIKTAIDKLYNCVLKLMYNITEKNVKILKKGKSNLKKYCQMFVENLIFEKTFVGLKVQEIIFKKVSEIMKKDFTWSNTKDDSSGIDGYINKIPISIKPKSCKIAKKPGVKRIIYSINSNSISFIHTI